MNKRLMRMTLAGALLLPAAGVVAAADSNNREVIKRNYDIFTSIVNSVDAGYVDSLPIQKMFDCAIEGFLSPLDPYTTFFNEKEAKEFLQSSKGEYAGIGAYLFRRGDYIMVSGPMEGSPAMMAGLRTGDRILRVDSLDAKGMTVEELRGHVQGLPGTDVSLRVARPYVGPDSVMDVTLTRQYLAVPTVPYCGVDEDGIGYVALTSFGENSPEEMRKAFKEILSHKNLKGMVIDLTGNGGGLLESAVEILEMIVPKGTTVLTTKGKTRGKEYATTEKPTIPSDLPLAVLINGDSASAAEVMAGVLQDFDRAVLVGLRSYGKGLVQSTMQAPYNTLLKVTTAKYYIPSGRLIQAYDYSRRNFDGSIAHVPDSLAKAFRTKGGRIVYDGGGLSPDSVVVGPNFTTLLHALSERELFFDFATKYAAENNVVSSPAEFRISDGTFEDFKTFVKESGFKYASDADEMLVKLRKSIEDDGYMSDDVEASLAALEKSLDHDLDHDLTAQRPVIEMLLTPEIMSRYHNHRGEIISFLNFAPDYRAAKGILLDQSLYDSILSGSGKSAAGNKNK